MRRSASTKWIVAALVAANVMFYGLDAYGLAAPSE